MIINSSPLLIIEGFILLLTLGFFVISQDTCKLTEASNVKKTLSNTVKHVSRHSQKYIYVFF